MQKPVLPDFLKEVIDIAYVVTLPLITSNFVDFPDIRLEFYGLLQALNKHCFTGTLLTLVLMELANEIEYRVVSITRIIPTQYQ